MEEQKIVDKSAEFEAMLSDMFPGKSLVFVVDDGEQLAVIDFGFKGLVKRLGLLEGALCVTKTQFSQWVTYSQPGQDAHPALLSVVEGHAPAETA